MQEKARTFKSGLRRNSILALSQSLVTTLCLFLVYRLLIKHAGVEQLGVWSLLSAGSSMVRIGDISGSNALARYVAVAVRDDNIHKPRDYVDTVILTSVFFNLLLGLLVYIVAPSLLPYFVTQEYLAKAIELIPFIVATLVLGGLGIAVTSGIDGAQRADRRAIVVIIAALIFFSLSVWLVPVYGIVGFGAAQLAQQLVLLLIGWNELRRHVPGLAWLPCHWHRKIFRETTGYALKMNAVGVMGLLFEPLSKFAFNTAGGPGLVAYYELASRLITQVRGLVIAAVSPLMPAFAAISEDRQSMSLMLKTSLRGAMLAALGTTVLALVGAPVMSLIILDRFEPKVLQMNAALTAGWAINILAVPLYFAAQGQGVLRWNFLSHLFIAVFVLIGVYILLPMFGPSGLVATIVMGLIVSMITVWYGNAYALGQLAVVNALYIPGLLTGIVISLVCSGVYGLITTYNL